MKILMPYKCRGTHRLHSPDVNGGIEMFARNLMNIVPEIIPVEILPEDRRRRRTKAIIAAAISKHNPHMVITNEHDYSTCGYFQEFGLPLIVIVHEGRVREIRNVELGKRLSSVMENGGHVYFVSRSQYEFHKAMHKRISGQELPPATGFIPSAFCPEHYHPSKEILWDCGTIGRTSLDKDPCYVHRMASKCDLSSVVLTDTHHSVKKHNASIEYARKSYTWEHPQETFRDLSHEETMEKLSHFGVYVSTCPVESWGITAMEALGHGVPLILLTDNTLTHASEDIAASQHHYAKHRKKEYDKVGNTVKEFLDMFDYDARCRISSATKRKNSYDLYIKKVEKMINYRLDTIDSVKYNRPSLLTLLK